MPANGGLAFIVVREHSGGGTQRLRHRGLRHRDALVPVQRLARRDGWANGRKDFPEAVADFVRIPSIDRILTVSATVNPHLPRAFGTVALTGLAGLTGLTVVGGAYFGVSTAVMLRPPSMPGGFSILAISSSALMMVSRISRPRSWWAFSRPRNMTFSFTLSCP